jgi:hypothetical protein
MPFAEHDGAWLGTRKVLPWNNRGARGGSVSTTDGERPHTLPPASAVLSELVNLRRYDGMSISRLRSNCPVLLELPVTINELERRGLNDSDRAVAAHRVLTCGVQTLIARSDFSRILSNALNIDGSDLLLDRRRHEVQQQLFMSEKAYRRTEDSAFEELAAALVVTRLTPCGATEGGLRPNVRVDLAYTTDNSTLIELLTMLGFERRPAVVEFHAKRILSGLPEARVVELRQDFPVPPTAWARLTILLSALISKRWPNQALTLQNEPVMSPRVVHMMLLLTKKGTNRSYTDVELIEFENYPDDRGNFRQEDAKPFDVDEMFVNFLPELKLKSYEQYYRIKYDAYSRLAALITTTERFKQWDEVMRGSGLAQYNHN